MRILTRYLLTQHAAPFAFAVAALTSFLLLNQIAKKIGDLLGRGLPWTVIAEFFLLTLPYVFAMTLSMSVLVAVLYTFSRLENDSEITAMRAGGVSLGQIVRPVLLAAGCVAVVAFLFGDQILPRTNHRLRVLMSDIATKKPTFSLKEHVINEVQRSRTFLRTAHIDQASYSMVDVAIYRTTGRGGNMRVVYADSGRFAFAPNHEDLQLILFDGTVHDFDRRQPGTFQRTSYERLLLSFENVGNEFIRREGDTYRSDRELGTCTLEDVALSARREQWLASRRAESIERNGLRALAGLAPVRPDTAAPPSKRSLYCRALAVILPQELEATARSTDTIQRQDPSARSQARINTSAGVTRRNRSPNQSMNQSQIHIDRANGATIRAANYLVEFHKKYAIPAACIVFVLVGVPAALRFPGAGLGMVIGVGMVVFGAYYIGLIAGESLANELKVPPFWAMWGPNAVFGTIGLVATWLTSRQGVRTRSN